MHEVDWDNQALDQLAAIWMKAADREAIVRASDEIDQLLEIDPINVGESRTDNDHRVLIQGPLMVYFQIIVSEKSVMVTSCRATNY
jgi:hypothetical protein